MKLVVIHNELFNIISHTNISPLNSVSSYSAIDTHHGSEHLISKSQHNFQSNHYNNNQSNSQRLSHKQRSVSLNTSPEIDANKCKSNIIPRNVLQSRELCINSDTIRCPNIPMQSHEYVTVLTNFDTMNVNILNNEICNPSAAMTNPQNENFQLLAVRDDNIIKVRQIKYMNIINNHSYSNPKFEHMSVIQKSSSYPSQSSARITTSKAMYNDINDDYAMIRGEPRTNTAFNSQQTPVNNFNITNTYEYHTNANSIADYKSSKESSYKLSLIIHDDNTMHFINRDNEKYINDTKANSITNDTEKREKFKLCQLESLKDNGTCGSSDTFVEYTSISILLLREMTL